METKRRCTKTAKAGLTKNKTWLLILFAGCITGLYQVAAQSVGSGGGHDKDRWTINHDNSNHWSHLRLQTDNDRAWNMINYGDLVWGYSTISTHSDVGSEKMRLHSDGNLKISGKLTSGSINGASPDFFGWGNTHGILTGSGSDSAFFGLVNRNGSAGGSNDYNTVVYFGDDINDDLEFRTEDQGEIMRLTGYGKLGIGTASPSEKLTLYDGEFTLQTDDNTEDQGILFKNSGDNYTWRMYRKDAGNNIADLTFASGITPNFTELQDRMILKNDGKIGIGTNSPSDKLTVYNGEFTLQTDDNTQDQGMLFQNSAGSYTWRIYRTDAGSNQAHLKFASGVQGNFSNLQDRMIIKNDGSIGVGTMSPAEKMEVVGTVKATSFVSSAASFPDYVFTTDHEITPLSELEAYVKVNKRLPNMPSEKEVVEKGLNVPEVIINSVENIETIYLHLIRMEKEIKALQQENAALKQQLKNNR